MEKMAGEVPQYCIESDIEDESLVDYNSEMYVYIERGFAEKQGLV